MTYLWMLWAPCTTSCCQAQRSEMPLSCSTRKVKTSSWSCPQQAICTLRSWMRPAAPSTAPFTSPMFWRSTTRTWRFLTMLFFHWISSASRLKLIVLSMAADWARHVFLHRTVMGRWLEAEFQCITPTSCRCSSSATVRASHLLPQWVAAAWKPRDSSPSMLKGKMQFCIQKAFHLILDDFDLTVFCFVVFLDV